MKSSFHLNRQMLLLALFREDSVNSEWHRCKDSHGPKAWDYVAVECSAKEMSTTFSKSHIIAEGWLERMYIQEEFYENKVHQSTESPKYV